MSDVKEKLESKSGKIDWFNIFAPFLIILAISLFLFSIYRELTKVVQLVKWLGEHFRKDTDITKAE